MIEKNIRPRSDLCRILQIISICTLVPAKNHNFKLLEFVKLPVGRFQKLLQFLTINAYRNGRPPRGCTGIITSMQSIFHKILNFGNKGFLGLIGCKSSWADEKFPIWVDELIRQMSNFFSRCTLEITYKSV